MTENFLTTLAIGEDEDGPEGIIAGPYFVEGTNAILNRRQITSLMRRDWWRSASVNKPVISGHAIAWALDLGDGPAADLVWDALGDPGRGTVVGATKTWKIGRPDDVRRFHLAFDPVEGGHFELRSAAIVQAQIVIERGRIPTIFTEWAGRQLTTTDIGWSPTAVSNTAYATPLTTTVDFGGGALPIFAASLAISREITAANYGEDKTARNWAGSLTPDAIGRLALRVTPANLATMLQGTQVEKAITITMVAGAKTTTITIPKCMCEAGERRMIAKGVYEDTVDFAAIRGDGVAAMTLSTTTS